MSAHDPFAPGSGAKPPSGKDHKAGYKAPTGDKSYVSPDDQTSTSLDGPEDVETPDTGDDSNVVPEGTVKEVLEWVGEDKDRAQAALDAENATDEPRKSLIKELGEVLS